MHLALDLRQLRGLVSHPVQVPHGPRPGRAGNQGGLLVGPLSGGPSSVRPRLLPVVAVPSRLDLLRAQLCPPHRPLDLQVGLPVQVGRVHVAGVLDGGVEAEAVRWNLLPVHDQDDLAHPNVLPLSVRDLHAELLVLIEPDDMRSGLIRDAVELVPLDVFHDLLNSRDGEHENEGHCEPYSAKRADLVPPREAHLDQEVKVRRPGEHDVQELGQEREVVVLRGAHSVRTVVVPTRGEV